MQVLMGDMRSREYWGGNSLFRSLRLITQMYFDYLGRQCKGSQRIPCRLLGSTDQTN